MKASTIHIYKTCTYVPLANQSVISSTVSDQELGYTRQGAPTAIITEVTAQFCWKFYFKHAHICVTLWHLIASQTYTTEEKHFKQISYIYCETKWTNWFHFRIRDAQSFVTSFSSKNVMWHNMQVKTAQLETWCTSKGNYSSFCVFPVYRDHISVRHTSHKVTSWVTCIGYVFI